MNRLASSWPIRLIAYSCATIAFILSLCLFGASKASQPVQTASAGVISGYYAALVDQRIVIYANGRDEPLMITDIDARTLPDADRELLEKGLPLAGADDVNRLLEDYGS